MEQLSRRGKTISRLTFGTAQIGLEYGIANATGKPDDGRVAEMLRYAVGNGVTSFDTARAYGDAETRLGRFLSAGDIPDTLYITTKLNIGVGKPVAGGVILSSGELHEYEEGFRMLGAGLEKAVIEAVEDSLAKLCLAKADCVMLHSPIEMMAGGKALAKAMGRLVAGGYAGEVGVSLYHPGEAEAMMRYDEYTAVQLPASLFDQKMIHSGTLKKLKERGIVVFVRSVFLQGVFFLDPDEMQDPLLIKHAAPYIRILRSIAADEGMSVTQLALSFIRDTEGVASLVLGCETVEQIRENVGLVYGPPISQKGMDRISREFRAVDVEGIMTVLRRPKNA